MKNGTPRGDGTSRYLRGADNVPATYEAFRSMLLSGTLPVDFLLNPNGWLVHGTPLNAANLLSDETAEKLGLTTEETQTVNHALSKLYDLASQVEGHTHMAADITAGVLAEARVPLLVPSERTVADVLTASYNANIPVGGGQVCRFAFSKKLDHIPKKVTLIIGWDCSSNTAGHTFGFYKGEGCCIDIFYNKASNRFDALFKGYWFNGGSVQKYGYSEEYQRNVNVEGSSRSGVVSVEYAPSGRGPKGFSPEAFWAGDPGGQVEGSLDLIHFTDSEVSFRLRCTWGTECTCAIAAVGYVYD